VSNHDEHSSLGNTHDRLGSDIYPVVKIVVEDVELFINFIENLVHEEDVSRPKDLCIIYCLSQIIY